MIIIVPFNVTINWNKISARLDDFHVLWILKERRYKDHLLLFKHIKFLCLKEYLLSNKELYKDPLSPE